MKLRFLTLSGAAASGKTTIAKAQLNWMSRLIVPVISTTTRPPRSSDLRGEYEHRTRKEFERLKEFGGLLWWKEIGGEFYGTRKEVVDGILTQNKKAGIMILTPDSIPLLKNYIAEKGMADAVYSVYILTFSYRHILEARMRRRGDTEESIRERLRLAEEWDAWASYNYSVFDRFLTNAEEDHSRPALKAAKFIHEEVIKLASPR